MLPNLFGCNHDAIFSPYISFILPSITVVINGENNYRMKFCSLNLLSSSHFFK